VTDAMLQALPIVGTLLAGLCVALCTIAAGPQFMGALTYLYRKARHFFGLEVLDRASAVTAVVAYLVIPPMFAAGGYYVFQHFVGVLGGAVLAVLAVRVYVLRLIEQHRELLEQQLPPAIDHLVAMMRGQLTLAKAMGELAAVEPSPVNTIFREVHRREMLFMPLDVALEEVAELTASGNVRLVLSSLAVFARQGGNAIEPLQEMSMAFKEIVRLAQKLRTASAESRATFNTINGAAAFMVVTMWFGQPSMLTVLATTAIGGLLLGVAIFFWLVGFFWMRKMVRIRI
jgi:tight adherence protein B